MFRHCRFPAFRLHCTSCHYAFSSRVKMMPVSTSEGFINARRFLTIQPKPNVRNSWHTVLAEGFAKGDSAKSTPK